MITSAYGLPSKSVIHTVGPNCKEIKDEKKEKKYLKYCIRSIFSLVEQYGIKSIALPGISSGVFGYPKEKCAEDILDLLIKLSE